MSSGVITSSEQLHEIVNSCVTHLKPESHGRLSMRNYSLACVSDAQRKLNFFGKDGYNIFGKNKFFAPRITWSILETRMERVRDAAEDYENAFNNVIQITNVDSNFNKVSLRVLGILRLFSRMSLKVTV